MMGLLQVSVTSGSKPALNQPQTPLNSSSPKPLLNDTPSLETAIYRVFSYHMPYTFMPRTNIPYNIYRYTPCTYIYINIYMCLHICINIDICLCIYIFICMFVYLYIEPTWSPEQFKGALQPSFVEAARLWPPRSPRSRPRKQAALGPRTPGPELQSGCVYIYIYICV